MFRMKLHLFVAAGLVLLEQCSSQHRDYFPPNLPVRVKRDAAPKPTNPLWESTSTDKLKHDLLLNYDKFARPMQHNNKTSVFLMPVLRHIELDERKSIMTIHCLAKMKWEDAKLKWNPEKYNGLEELHLADHEVWQPDVLPYNSASGSAIDHYGNTNLIAFDNGTVVWVPPSIFHVFCRLDFTEWPFDTQTCELKMGSWTYNGEEVDLYNNDHDMTLYEVDGLFPNSEWIFESMTVERNEVKYPCCTKPYVDLTFYITIKRCSHIYRLLFIMPACVLVMMTFGIFLIPAPSGDKITLASAALIINVLFILYFSQKMPVMTGTTPYIVSFYSWCMYLTTFALFIAVTVINLTAEPKTSPLPWIIKRNLIGCLGKVLIPCPCEKMSSTPQEMTDNQPVLPEQGRQHLEDRSKSYQKDWMLLATFIDRVVLGIYMLIFLLLIIVYYF